MIDSPESAMNAAADEVRDLVVAAQQGDQGAFGELYRKFARMVHGMLLSRIPPAEVEDLVQEVFLSALRKLKDLREPAAFGSWVAMIARNRAADFYRDRLESTELTENHASSSPGAPARIDAVTVLEVIQGLPEAYRETLVLRLVEGMTGPEIAERTGLGHGSVRVNLHRGMELLREALEKGVQR
ncbi:MAG: sigma-70 family RNA polymerase sigma factor [Acidobacteriia bacterium]|nr:sigma-70 family RNA polymerase sigma factor [Terriglobia bacterium]